MPNSNPQAILIANSKLRPLADAFAGLYNASKSAQIEFIAENWTALFPNDSEPIVDGSATDGRTEITNADVVAFMNFVGSFITAMEASSNAQRNNAFKIAPNPRVI
jgi:hypothetical protein